MGQGRVKDKICKCLMCSGKVATARVMPGERVQGEGNEYQEDSALGVGWDQSQGAHRCLPELGFEGWMGYRTQ